MPPACVVRGETRKTNAEAPESVGQGALKGWGAKLWGLYPGSDH